MRIFFGLATTTILLFHSVGAVSFTMMPLLSRSSSFTFTSFLIAIGIRLEVCCTGVAEGSTTKLLVPMCPDPYKTS